MFRPYFVVLATPGLAISLVTTFLGSLPIGMLNLGILLLIQDTTGSFTRAGAVVAAFSVGNGLGCSRRAG